MRARAPQQQIRDRLEYLGITQAGVAREFDIDPSIVNLWSSGKRPIPSDRLEKFASILELSLDEVLAIEAGMGHHTLAMATPEPPPPDPLPRPDGVPSPETPPEIKPIPRPPLDPYPLAWCTSTHGTGIQRRHHHGPKASYGPPGPLP